MATGKGCSENLLAKWISQYAGNSTIGYAS